MRQSVQLSCKSLQWYALAVVTHINFAVESPSISISGNLANFRRTSSLGKGPAAFWVDDPDEWIRSSQILVIAFA